MIIPLSIIRLIRYSPSGVRVRTLQTGPLGYQGSSGSPSTGAEARLGGVWSLSTPEQALTFHQRPVMYLLPTFTRTPVVPPSIVVPPKALSNLWIGNSDRTPRSHNS